MATTLAANAALPLTQEWDKTFPKSDKVEHSKVTFRNRFGIELAADLYKPKAGNGERGMGNGERGMGNGERGTGNSRRLRSAARSVR